MMLRRRSLLAAGALALAGCEARQDLRGSFAGETPERGHLLRTLPAAGGAVTVRRADVVIAGGGVAGLAAARRLRLAGIENFVMLELEDDAGGNSRAGLLGGMPCPLGAHYLPVPGDNAPEVREFLQEAGLARHSLGRWTYDELHLCHSPQERLYFNGHWQEGLLPVQGVDHATLDQYRAFSRRVASEQKRSPFVLPLRGEPSAAHLDLDALTFSSWLDREGFTAQHLRWYLDYCCRDDYGAPASVVSAWAGIHYFASRHGFSAPGEEGERDALLTWPEGNAWLARHLSHPLSGRLRTGQVVTRIESARSHVEVEALDARTGSLERWECRQCVVALPLFVSRSVVHDSLPALAQAANLSYSPWVVVDLQLSAPPKDAGGAAPAWDNVLYGTAGLGWVDAAHQRLDPRPGPCVITWYRPFGGEAGARESLLAKPWTAWKDAAVAELSAAHPDLASKTVAALVARFGHAMAQPVPGTRANRALTALRNSQGRLHFAHADLSGYSIFEEAFTHGDRAARQVIAALSRKTVSPNGAF